jgi:hypothetical protein
LLVELIEGMRQMDPLSRIWNARVLRSDETDSLGQTLKIVNRQGLAVYNGEFSTEATNVNESDTEDTSDTFMEDSHRREH